MHDGTGQTASTGRLPIFSRGVLQYPAARRENYLEVTSMKSAGKHRSLAKNIFLISIILLWSSFAFAQSPQSEPGQVSKAEPAKKTAASSSSAFHEDWN